MATVSYRGRTPSSDSSVVTKEYISTRHDQITVTEEDIDGLIAPTLSPLATQSYVDAGDATRAKKAQVDAADLNYIPVSQRGAVNGVASTDASNYVPSGQLPSLITDRQHTLVDSSVVYLTGEQTTTASGSFNGSGGIENGKEYLAARLTVSDPGYDYLLLPFATVLGRSPFSESGSNRLGGLTFGKMAILTQNDVCWGFGIAGNNTYWAVQHAVPFTGPGGVPTNGTALTGSTTLSLWLSNWGTVGGEVLDYQWSNIGFSFYTWVVPAA